MKIMHVIESLGIGGAERSLVVLLPALQQLGNDVTVVVRADRLDLKAALIEAGVPVVQMAPRHKWNLIGAALNMARLAKDFQADVIHAHLYFPAQSTAVMKLLRLYRAVSVITLHNLAYAEGVNKRGIRLTLKRRLAAVLYPRGFDRKIAVSCAVAAHYRSSLGLDDIEVVHNPVDIEAVDQLTLPNGRVAGRVLQIAVPGRLVHEKGQADLLQALQILREQGLAFTATIIGDGPMRAALQQQTSVAGLDDVVAFTGTLEHAKLLEVVARADIVVMPSRSEGFPLTAVEAMALARPLIVTAAGGLVEIVDDGVSGIVVPVKDPRALAQAMQRLLDSPAERVQFGRAGRERVERDFSLPRIALQLHALYDEAVRERVDS